MSNKPIKSSLFSFVSVRTPQQISKDKKLWVAIEHPNASKSFFRGLSNLIHSQHLKSTHKAKEKAREFKQVKSVPEVRAEFSEFIHVVQWLEKRRKKLSVEEVKNLISSMKTLLIKQELLVWDLLIYEMIEKENPIIRQLLIDILRANHFIKYAKERIRKKGDKKSVERSLNRLAVAKVVFPRSLNAIDDDVVVRQPEEKPEVDTIKEHPALEKEHMIIKREFFNEFYLSISQNIRRGLSSALQKMKVKGKIVQPTLESAKGEFTAETQDYINSKKGKSTTPKEINAAISRDLSTIRGGYVTWEKRQKLKLEDNALDKYYETIPPYSGVASLVQTNGRVFPFVTFVTHYPNGFAKEVSYNLKIAGKVVAEGKDFTLLDDHSKQGVSILVGEGFSNVKKGVFELSLQVKFGGSESESYVFEGPTTRAVVYPKPIVKTAKLKSEKKKEVIGKNNKKGQQLRPIAGVNRLGVGVFRRVEQEICCYVPGEVSHIENILAREYKERHTRKLSSSEITTETSSEFETENQSDTATTTRNELQKEISNELSKDTSLSAGANVGVEGKLGPATTVSADGYFDYASSSAATMADSQAESYAKEVTQSATERVLRKTSEKRVSRILTEYEENNRHGFDNREGDSHVTGVYRWVDIIYKNRLINYGAREMIEFLVPEPARFYREAIKPIKKPENKPNRGGSINTGRSNVVTLEDMNIFLPSDITANNYSELSRTFKVSIPDPVPEQDEIVQSFLPSDDPRGENPPNGKNKINYNYAMRFFDHGDYSQHLAYRVEVTGEFEYKRNSTTTGTHFDLQFASKRARWDKNGKSAYFLQTNGTKKTKKTIKETLRKQSIKNSLNLSLSMSNVYSFTLQVKVFLEVDADVLDAWQQDAYDALQRGYQLQLEAQQREENEAEAEQDAKNEIDKKASDQQQRSQSSSANRAIEQREMKRIAIEMMTQHFGVQQGMGFYEKDICNSGNVVFPLDADKLEKLNRYSAEVKFFEQAIDWNLMSYLFYPYYWATKCRWQILLNERSASDPIFEGFLQSGMARMVVPVRRGFEKAVNHYLETGEIWNGDGLVLDADDDLYLSIDEEIEDDTEFVVGEEWETRLPTTLTIVQGNSVYLDDTGLPCCDSEDDTGVTGELQGTDNIMQAKSSS